MTRVLAVLVASTFVTSQGATQQGSVTMKGRAPVSAEILKVKLPRPVEVDLPHGIHLMLLEDHRVRHERGAARDAVRPAADGMLHVGVDADDADVFREPQRGLEMVG